MFTKRQEAYLHAMMEKHFRQGIAHHNLQMHEGHPLVPAPQTPGGMGAGIAQPGGQPQSPGLLQSLTSNIFRRQ